MAQHAKPVGLCLSLLFQAICSPHRLPPFIPAVTNCLQVCKCSKLSLASCILSLECPWQLRPTFSTRSSVSLLGTCLWPAPHPILVPGRSMPLPHALQSSHSLYLCPLSTSKKVFEGRDPVWFNFVSPELSTGPGMLQMHSHFFFKEGEHLQRGPQGVLMFPRIGDDPVQGPVLKPTRFRPVSLECSQHPAKFWETEGEASQTDGSILSCCQGSVVLRLGANHFQPGLTWGHVLGGSN